MSLCRALTIEHENLKESRFKIEGNFFEEILSYFVKTIKLRNDDFKVHQENVDFEN